MIFSLRMLPYTSERLCGENEYVATPCKYDAITNELLRLPFHVDIRVIIIVTPRSIQRICTCVGAAILTSGAIPTPRRLTSQPPLLLELAPSFHGDLAGIELSFVFDACFLGFLAGGLARVAPGEIVEFPECVGWKDEVPDWEGDEVDQHPDYVGPAVGG